LLQRRAVGGRRRRDRGLGRGGEGLRRLPLGGAAHVLPGDQAAVAGRGDRAQVDAEVLGELAHRRLGEHRAGGGRLLRHRRGGGRGGRGLGGRRGGAVGGRRGRGRP